MPCSKATKVESVATSRGIGSDLTDKDDSIEMTDIIYPAETKNVILARYHSSPKDLTRDGPIDVITDCKGLISVRSWVSGTLESKNPPINTIDKVKVNDMKTVCDRAEAEWGKRYGAGDLKRLAEQNRNSRSKWCLDVDTAQHEGKTAVLYEKDRKVGSIDNQTVNLAYTLDFAWCPAFNLESDSEQE